MKTAKQLIEDVRYNSVNGDFFMFTEEQMAIFWSQLCKEQRDICASTDDMNDMRFHDIADWVIKENIRNAPEPEIE